MDKSRFVGTWSLVSFIAHTEDGTVIQPLGPDPEGLIIYDAAGHMAAQLGARHRAPFADPGRGTHEEEHAALSSYSAYFGTYDVSDSGEVIHHTAGNLNPNLAEVDQRRLWAFDGDRLTLRAEHYPIGGVDFTLELVWERVA